MTESTTRWYSDKLVLLSALTAIALSIFQIWQGITADLSAPVFRPVHLSWVLILVFLTIPLVKSQQSTALYLNRALCSIFFVLPPLHGLLTILYLFDYDDISCF